MRKRWAILEGWEGDVNPKRTVKSNHAVINLLRNLLHRLSNHTDFTVRAKS
jgi:hypothetical protein